ncbi:MAG TPA: sensor histidine kinase [Chloroflexota bacterium]|nr:sensor histidine kinase [Chloroflexota bacterium]HUM71583.1 sensor histidine kinase [Chloroflexota bacterium]
MEPQRELGPYQPWRAFQEAEQQEKFTNRTLNIVVITLTMIGYLPLLLDSRFYQLPTLHMLLILGSGILYGFVGTKGMTWFEAKSKTYPWFIGVYFVVMMGIVALTFWLTAGVDNNAWLLILPVAAQSLALPRAGTAVVSITLLALIYFIFLRYTAWENALQAMMQISAALIFTLIFTYIALREAAARSRITHLATELHSANLRLAEYAAQAEEMATIKERNRLAREIHDNLGHYLTVINVQLEAARTIMPENPDKAADAIQKAQKLTQEGLSAIRHSISALRESPLENQTLPQAIGQLITETQQTGLDARLEIMGTPVELEAKASLTLYRVAQEGLTNTRKHAQATQVIVTLDYSQPEQVTLSVVDDGAGTAVPADSGFGLMGIRERVQLLGGDTAVTTIPGEGFSLVTTIPLPPEHVSN